MKLSVLFLPSFSLVFWSFKVVMLFKCAPQSIVMNIMHKLWCNVWEKTALNSPQMWSKSGWILYFLVDDAWPHSFWNFQQFLAYVAANFLFTPDSTLSFSKMSSFDFFLLKFSLGTQKKEKKKKELKSSFLQVRYDNLKILWE